MNPIRVLFLIPNLRTGGAQQFTVTLLAELRKHAQIEPAVAVMAAPGDLEPDLLEHGFTIERFNKKSLLPSTGWLFALARRLNAGNYDILQMQGASAALWGCLLTAANPSVIRLAAYHTMHGWRKARKRWFTNRIHRPLVHRYVAVCQAEKESLGHCYNIHPRRVDVIPNCVDSIRYSPGRVSLEPRRRLGLPTDRPLAGMVGRHSGEKGGDVFINAMAILKEKGIKVHGALIGDGRERAGWQELVHRLGVDDAVTFTGRIPQERMPEVIRCLDIGVVPSYQECCSVAILEQMACGLPVVATDVGGNAELVDHGRTGLVVPSANPALLASAIQRLLQTPADMEQYGRNGRLKIEKHFTIPAVTDQYVALYTTLHRGSRGATLPAQMQPARANGAA